MPQNLRQSLIFLSFVPVSTLIMLKTEHFDVKKLIRIQHQSDVDKILQESTTKIWQITLICVVYFSVVGCLGLDQNVWLAIIVPLSLCLTDLLLLLMNFSVKLTLIYLFMVRVTLC